jgi:hypothetical protein
MQVIVRDPENRHWFAPLESLLLGPPIARNYEFFKVFLDGASQLADTTTQMVLPGFASRS